MDSDDGRLLVAIAIATALAFPTILWAVETNLWPELMADQEAVSLTLVYMAIFWILFGLAYMVLTLVRFWSASPRRLYRDLRIHSRGPSERSIGFWRIGSTLSWTVQLSFTALVVVVAMMLDPMIRGHLELRVLGVLVVAVSWGMLVIAQALAYARTYAKSSRSGVEFAGTSDPVLSDFITLSVCISAMFGPADATLSGRSIRGRLRNHVLVSFAFNSMVVASLATLLLVTS
ncbi:DUF1345 domain-containing protein [Micrococcus sp. IITD107]|uniref:DUF1345 domain-containing protein n=1 Tax=Micrococcus sp. IITD107 TaxID=3342790 RepID=UPI0035B9A86F